MRHMCVGQPGQHWFREWLVAWTAPSRYLNQCWNIVDMTLRNKLQWNINQNTKLFFHKNVFENVVCEMAAILSRERWVKCMNCCDLSDVQCDEGKRHQANPGSRLFIICKHIAVAIYITAEWIPIKDKNAYSGGQAMFCWVECLSSIL